MINIEYLEKVAMTSEKELKKKRFMGLPYNNYITAGALGGISTYKTNKALRFIPGKYRYPLAGISGSLGAATGFDLQEAWDHTINNKLNNIKILAADTGEYLLNKATK